MLSLSAQVMSDLTRGQVERLSEASGHAGMTDHLARTVADFSAEAIARFGSMQEFWEACARAWDFGVPIYEVSGYIASRIEREDASRAAWEAVRRTVCV